MAGDGRRSAAPQAMMTLAALVVAGLPPPTAAQFIVQPTGRSCPSSRVFLGSFDDDHAAYTPLSGLYIGADSDSGPATTYHHELGHASLRLYASQQHASARKVYVWYVEVADAPVSDPPALPPPGPVVADDSAAPRSHVRSVPSDSAGAPWNATWQVWAAGDWQEPRVQFPGKDAGASCAATLKARCVGAAWRCPAGRLHVSGMPYSGEQDMVPTPLAGRLLGADEPAFSGEDKFAVDDDSNESVDVPFSIASGETADGQRLGTFLLTNRTHVNRPVYRHVRRKSRTFLYFDKLATLDGARLPLWIVGPEPGRVDLATSRLFFVVDAARRPEEITGCWQYRAAGHQIAALLNATCEHGRTGPLPLTGADCRFELPGACGYRATDGQLTQVPYTAGEERSAREAGDATPGAFFAQLTSDDGGKAEVISRPFTPVVNSCLSLHYEIRTDAFFGAFFSLVSEADAARDMMLTMFAAGRRWARVAHDVSPGSYRLQVRTTELSEVDALRLDSVWVVPGACNETYTWTPCVRRPCLNGGTCLPTVGKAYTCVCRRGYQGRNCRASVTCPPPPEVKYGRALVVPTPDDALPTARYVCQAGFDITAPLTRSLAMCLAGQWRGVLPSCQRSSGGPTAVLPPGGGSAAGRPADSASGAVLTATAALAAVAALRTTLLTS